MGYKFDGKGIGLYPEILQAAREQGISHNDVFEFELADNFGSAIITTFQHQRYTVNITGPIHVHSVEGSAIVLPDEEPRQLASPKEQA